MKEMYKGLNIVGVDETGVGDYLTPLVACACFVPKENVAKLIKMGVTDSKKISDEKIQKLSNQIKKMIIFRIKHLSQTGYNKLNNNFNANELKMFLHLASINTLEEKIDDVDMVIIDQFSTENSIKKYYKKLLNSSFDFKPIKSKVKLAEKGEMEHVSVAAASIMARDFLIKKMKEQNDKYKTIFPLGTNKKVEDFAIKFVKKHGEDELNNVAKLSFKTTKKVVGND